MVLGIDLGTTYSVGAYIDRNGDPRVIENAEGSHLTPSVVMLENRRDRLMCIVAGYGKEMDAFLAVNQGLKSRLSNEVIFEDYTLDEMQQIFYKMAEKKGLILEQGSEQAVRGMIENAKKGTADFGNARGVRNLLENCIRRKDSRIASSLREGKALENEELLTLRKEDLL